MSDESDQSNDWKKSIIEVELTSEEFYAIMIKKSLEYNCIDNKNN